VHAERKARIDLARDLFQCIAELKSLRSSFDVVLIYLPQTWEDCFRSFRKTYGWSYREFGSLCWFSKTNASFRNPALDFQIPCRFSKPNTSFQNPALNFEILRWFLKTGTGFQNPALDSQIPR